VNQKASLRAARLNFHLVAAAVAAAGILSVAAAEEPKPHHWSYTGPSGPAHWATEDDAYATCGIGKAQSPVNIEKTTKQELPPLEFSYQPSPLRVTDTGHSMQVNYQAGSVLAVDGARYELVQFHFHKPSEEHLHGHAYSMVAHLVHKSDKGELAVVAVLLRRGKTNAFLQRIFDNFPAPGTTESSVAGQTVNAAEFLPAGHGYFSFEGSLTTPPCSEHVRWFVLKTPAEVSAAQIQQFGSRYARNARPVQPLNGRVILESKD
jgi:carbonic anhydrase